MSKGSISVFFSHLYLGLTSGLQEAQEISLLEASGLRLYDAIHDTDLCTITALQISQSIASEMCIQYSSK
jgi:hypothetical protein